MASTHILAVVSAFVLLYISTLPSYASSQLVGGRSFERYEDVPELRAEPRKRPFCNAFTGCGRKRSSPAQHQLIQEIPSYRKPIMEDSMDTLIDMSSEPAVEDVLRQIMSEAKLSEAIQEAGAELARRRKAGH